MGSRGVLGQVQKGLTSRRGGSRGAGGGGLGLPRAQLGQSYQKARPLDPFDLSAHGLDPGLGTMLFQGVAEVR